MNCCHQNRMQKHQLFLLRRQVGSVLQCVIMTRLLSEQQSYTAKQHANKNRKNFSENIATTYYAQECYMHEDLWLGSVTKHYNILKCLGSKAFCMLCTQLTCDIEFSSPRKQFSMVNGYWSSLWLNMKQMWNKMFYLECSSINRYLLQVLIIAVIECILRFH